MKESLHAEVTSGGDGPYCLLIHGFLSSRAQWRHNLLALALVCRPVVVELWGHGRSPAPAEPHAYSVEAYLAQFEKLRQQLSASEWFVCGQSMGACLALHYAASHPAVVRGTIFTNSMAAFLTPAELRRDGTEELTRDLESGGPAARDALRALPMHVSNARRLPPLLMEEMLGDAELLACRAIALTIRHLTPELPVLPRLMELHGPMLLVNGRFESRFQPMRDLAARRLTQLEVVDLEGGHSVNVDCADAFNAAAAGFIGRRAP